MSHCIRTRRREKGKKSSLCRNLIEPKWQWKQQWNLNGKRKIKEKENLKDQIKGKHERFLIHLNMFASVRSITTTPLIPVPSSASSVSPPASPSSTSFVTGGGITTIKLLPSTIIATPVTSFTPTALFLYPPSTTDLGDCSSVSDFTNATSSILAYDSMMRNLVANTATKFSANYVRSDKVSFLSPLFFSLVCWYITMYTITLLYH